MLDDINKSVWIKEQIVRAEYEAALKKKYDKERELEIKRLKEEKTQMVKSLYQNGVSIDLIAKSSNLSIDEVKKIIGKNQ